MDFCLLLKVGAKIGKNINKNLSGKYSPFMLAAHQEIFDHVKQSTANALNTASKRSIQKRAEATGNLIDNKIAEKIKKASRI